MLEIAAVVAIGLLVPREFLALGTDTQAERAARWLGWAATPFLLAFALLITARVLSYLANG